MPISLKDLGINIFGLSYEVFNGHVSTMKVSVHAILKKPAPECCWVLFMLWLVDTRMLHTVDTDFLPLTVFTVQIVKDNECQPFSYQLALEPARTTKIFQLT